MELVPPLDGRESASAPAPGQTSGRATELDAANPIPELRKHVGACRTTGSTISKQLPRQYQDDMTSDVGRLSEMSLEDYKTYSEELEKQPQEYLQRKTKLVHLGGTVDARQAQAEIERFSASVGTFSSNMDAAEEDVQLLYEEV